MDSVDPDGPWRYKVADCVAPHHWSTWKSTEKPLVRDPEKLCLLSGARKGKDIKEKDDFWDILYSPHPPKKHLHKSPHYPTIAPTSMSPETSPRIVYMC